MILCQKTTALSFAPLATRNHSRQIESGADGEDFFPGRRPVAAMFSFGASSGDAEVGFLPHLI